MFKLEFDTDNAAFEPIGGLDETARILQDVARRISQGETSGRVRDVNGNCVGHFELKTEVWEPDSEEE